MITAPFVVLKVIRQKTNLCKAYLESAIFVMNHKSINLNGFTSYCLAKCPNRTLSDVMCERDYCSEKAPLKDKDANCHPYNKPLPIDVDGDETKCGACLNRTLDGRYCILNSTTLS